MFSLFTYFAYSLLNHLALSLNISVCFDHTNQAKGLECKDKLDDHVYTKNICKGKDECERFGRILCSMDPNCYGFMIQEGKFTGVIPCVSQITTDRPEKDMHVFKKCKVDLPKKGKG